MSSSTFFAFYGKLPTFEHREVAIENKTSISAISYQETRRVRQRTGAHGWQSLSSLSRQTSDKHQKFLDRYLVCQENFGFYYIQQGQISDKCRIYRIYQIYLFIQLKRIFIYLFISKSSNNIQIYFYARLRATATRNKKPASRKLALVLVLDR